MGHWEHWLRETAEKRALKRPGGQGVAATILVAWQ